MTTRNVNLTVIYQARNIHEQIFVAGGYSQAKSQEYLVPLFGDPAALGISPRAALQRQ